MILMHLTCECIFVNVNADGANLAWHQTVSFCTKLDLLVRISAGSLARLTSPESCVTRRGSWRGGNGWGGQCSELGHSPIQCWG